ncbi:MAG TPA: ribonuclease P protein component [Patescibacteria group bacterium]
MLPKQHRLSKDRDFQKVFKAGRSVFSAILNLKVLKTSNQVSRFGIIVSNKVSKRATARNKIKRQLRGALQTNLEKLKPGYDCVIIAKQTILDKEYEEIEATLFDLLRKAGTL